MDPGTARFPARVLLVGMAGAVLAIAGIAALSEPGVYGQVAAHLPLAWRDATLPWLLVIGGLTLTFAPTLAWFVQRHLKV